MGTYLVNPKVLGALAPHQIGHCYKTSSGTFRYIRLSSFSRKKIEIYMLNKFRQKKIELVCHKTSYVLIDFSVSTFSLAIIANLFSYLICYKYIHLKTQNNFSTIFSPICFFLRNKNCRFGKCKLSYILQILGNYCEYWIHNYVIWGYVNCHIFYKF